MSATASSINFRYSPDSDDGVKSIYANGSLVGEVIENNPTVWDIQANRPVTKHFFEAVDLDGEILDPMFATREAAAAALVRRAGMSA